jgi:hypothetical protein
MAWKKKHFQNGKYALDTGIIRRVGGICGCNRGAARKFKDNAVSHV